MAPYQRTGRIMPGNKSDAIPRYILSLHCDSVEVINGDRPNIKERKFSGGTAIFSRVRGDNLSEMVLYTISSPADLHAVIKSLTSPRRTIWIVCYGAIDQFIMNEFPEAMERGEYVIDWPARVRPKDDGHGDKIIPCQTISIDGLPTVIALRCGSTQGRFIMLDIRNYTSADCKDILSTRKCESLQKTIAKTAGVANLTSSQQTAASLLTAFADIVAYVRTHDLGMFRYTIAAQSLAAFRHRFMNERVYLHDNMEVKQLERDSLFGGRTEVFKVGKTDETVFQLDVNSLFPSVMRANLFPYKLNRYDLDRQLSKFWPKADLSRCVARVVVETDQPLYPLRLADKVAYPVGCFETVLSGPDLALAEASGQLILVGQYAEYDVACLFESFVDSLWGLRDLAKANNDPIGSRLSKLLLNCLHGKFSQRSASWQTVADKMSALPWQHWVETNAATGERCEYRSFGWQVQKMASRDEIPSSFPAIASWVTAYARQRMDALRQIAGYHAVLYQGVDGLLVTRDGYLRLSAADEVRESEIGYLRYQKQADGASVYGTCDYRIGGELKVSGLSSVRQFIDENMATQTVRMQSASLFAGSAGSSIKYNEGSWRRKQNAIRQRADQFGWVEPEVIDHFQAGLPDG